MSTFGPIQEPKFFENDLAKLVLSDFDKSDGLIHIPPLPPPNGILIIAHFMVIQKLNDLTSSTSTSKLYRRPPL